MLRTIAALTQPHHTVQPAHRTHRHRLHPRHNGEMTATRIAPLLVDPRSAALLCDVEQHAHTCARRNERSDLTGANICPLRRCVNLPNSARHTPNEAASTGRCRNCTKSSKRRKCRMCGCPDHFASIASTGRCISADRRSNTEWFRKGRASKIESTTDTELYVSINWMSQYTRTPQYPTHRAVADVPNQLTYCAICSISVRAANKL